MKYDGNKNSNHKNECSQGMVHIQVPDEIDKLRGISAGTEVLLSGTIYSARDQAHQRFCAGGPGGAGPAPAPSNSLESASDLPRVDRPQNLPNLPNLPIDLRGQIIYYMGPAPTPPGKVIGSCGPTTSGRMDRFTPPLLKLGLAGMIGKGPRSPAVVKAIKQHRAVYLYAYGGCGALYAQRITGTECAAFADLGPEAVYRLTIEDFPVIVAIDAQGNTIL